MADNGAAQIAGAGKGRIEAQGRLAPNNAGHGAENKTEADGQDDDGELRLADNAAHHHCIDQKAEHGHHRHGRQKTEPKIKAPSDDKGEGDKGADHHNVALREIDHFGGFVNHHKTHGDKAVNAALRQTDNQKL